MEKKIRENRSIKNWSPEDRPREKMIRQGTSGMSSAELLAILIHHGTAQYSALDLARQLLQLGRENLDELGKLSISQLQQIPGIGPAKAVAIASALELGRRRYGAGLLEKKSIKGSQDLAEYLKVSLKDLPYEVFAVVYLNQANKINQMEIISKGGITGTVADPRIILGKALETRATGIVLCHNHPSGNLVPSQADKDITQKIRQAASFMDIRVLDHIIVSDEGYYSFADEGLL